MGISVILVVFQTSENAKDKRKALIIDLIKRSVTGTLALRVCTFSVPGA